MYSSSPDIIVKKIIILTIEVKRFREDFYNGNTFFIIVRELLLILSDQYSISILNLEDCRGSWFFLQSLFYRENANYERVRETNSRAVSKDNKTFDSMVVCCRKTLGASVLREVRPLLLYILFKLRKVLGNCICS